MCSRHQTCHNSRDKEFNYLYHFQDGKVLLEGVKEQQLHLNKKALAKQKRAVGEKLANPRKMNTHQPSLKEDCCPFYFVIFLNSDNHWYLKLSHHQLANGNTPGTHWGHAQLSTGEVKGSTTNLLSDELEELHCYNKAHLSSSVAAHLLSEISDFQWLPIKISYVNSKANQLAAGLTPHVSSADKLVEYLKTRDGISYMILTDHANSGLLVTRGKGCPKSYDAAVDPELLSSFKGNQIGRT